MKLRLKRQNIKVNEDGVGITDPTLLSQSIQLHNEKQKIQDIFNKAQEEYNKAQENYNKQMKIINDKLAQIMKNQESLSKNSNTSNNSNQQPQNNQTTTQQESLISRTSKRYKLFENESKKNLLVDAISDILDSNSDIFSYELSSDEIRRMARKINDYLNEHKKEDLIWSEDVRYMIKNYILKHNTISWSQSEINDFNNLLEEELLTNYEEEFSKYL